jgi:hypothetical protein
MKINEIITEAGIGMKLGQGILNVAGALGSNRAGQAVRQSNALAQQHADTQKNHAMARANAQIAPTSVPAVPVGQQLQVQLAMQPGQTKPAFAYKRSTGWVNELGQPITQPTSIQDLENLLAARPGKLLNIPVPAKFKQRTVKRSVPTL